MVRIHEVKKALESGALVLHDGEQRARFLAIAAKGPDWKKYSDQSFAVIQYLERLETFVGGTFGVESLWPDAPDFFYLNNGETYQETLCFKRGSLLWRCWGSEIEALERKNHAGNC